MPCGGDEPLGRTPRGTPISRKEPPDQEGILQKAQLVINRPLGDAEHHGPRDNSASETIMRSSARGPRAVSLPAGTGLGTKVMGRTLSERVTYCVGQGNVIVAYVINCNSGYLLAV